MFFVQTATVSMASSNLSDAFWLRLVEVSVHPEDAHSTWIVKELLEVKVVVPALVTLG